MVFAEDNFEVGEVDVDAEVLAVDKFHEVCGLGCAPQETAVVFYANPDVHRGGRICDFGHAVCDAFQDVVHVRFF